jgi:hypothetical protein
MTRSPLRALTLAVALGAALAGCSNMSLVGSGGSESKPDVGVVFNLDLFNIFRGRRAPDPIPQPPEQGSRPRERVPEEEKGPERDPYR